MPSPNFRHLFPSHTHLNADLSFAAFYIYLPFLIAIVESSGLLKAILMRFMQCLEEKRWLQGPFFHPRFHLPIRTLALNSTWLPAITHSFAEAWGAADYEPG